VPTPSAASNALALARSGFSEGRTQEPLDVRGCLLAFSGEASQNGGLMDDHFGKSKEFYAQKKEFFERHNELSRRFSEAVGRSDIAEEKEIIAEREALMEEERALDYWYLGVDPEDVIAAEPQVAVEPSMSAPCEPRTMVGEIRAALDAYIAARAEELGAWASSERAAGMANQSAFGAALVQANAASKRARAAASTLSNVENAWFYPTEEDEALREQIESSPDEASPEAHRARCLRELGQGTCSVTLHTVGASEGELELDAIRLIPWAFCGVDYTDAMGLYQRVEELGSQEIVSGVSFEGAVSIKRRFEGLGLRAKVREGRPPARVSPSSPRQPIPESVRHEVWRRDGGRCVDCGERELLEFDHVIPLSKGGSNTARNIELRCQECNRKKGARI